MQYSIDRRREDRLQPRLGTLQIGRSCAFGYGGSDYLEIHVKENEYEHIEAKGLLVS